VILSSDRGLFTTTDFGLTFKALVKDKTSPLNSAAGLAVIGKYVLAATVGGVYRSTNGGAFWLPPSSNILTFGPGSAVKIFCLTRIGSRLFAGTNLFGFAHTDDDGADWQTGVGLTNNTVYSFATLGGNIFVGTDTGGIYQSQDNGSSWVPLLGMTNSYPVRALIAINSDLFAGTDGGGIYHSIDNGITWTPVNLGLINKNVYCLTTIGSDLFAGTNGGIFRTADNGKTWIAINRDLPMYGTSVEAFASRDTDFFAATSTTGIFLSNSLGVDWSNIGTRDTFQYDNLTSIVTGDSTIFAGGILTYYSSSVTLFRSTDNGITWILSGEGLGGIDVLSLSIIGEYLYAGTANGIWRRSLSDFNITYSSVTSAHEDNSSISLFPNPTTGIITVHNAPANILRVTITNVLGETFSEFTNPGAADFTIDLSKLLPGTYFARFSSVSEVVTRKIIKE